MNPEEPKPTFPPPPRAWIIVACGWEYDDEGQSPSGEYPRTDLYYDRSAAEAECRRLCEEFYGAEPPEEFVRDLEPAGDDWESALAAGVPEPFYVLELTIPDPGRS